MLRHNSFHTPLALSISMVIAPTPATAFAGYACSHLSQPSPPGWGEWPPEVSFCPLAHLELGWWAAAACQAFRQIKIGERNPTPFPSSSGLLVFPGYQLSCLALEKKEETEQPKKKPDSTRSCSWKSILIRNINLSHFKWPIFIKQCKSKGVRWPSEELKNPGFYGKHILQSLQGGTGSGMTMDIKSKNPYKTEGRCYRESNREGHETGWMLQGSIS